MLFKLFFLVFLVGIIYLLIRDYRVIKNEFKNDPKSMLLELLFISGLFIFIAGLFINDYIISNVAAIFLLLLSLKNLVNLWKTNKLKVIYCMVMFTLFFSVQILLD